MAVNKLTRSQAKQSRQFASTLYYSIWAKFRILASEQNQYVGKYPEGCRTDIHKAVICEQLLLRDFLTNHFFRDKHLVVMESTESVLAFCNIMCLSTIEKWDVFKRVLRCSALIAEFFLYRYPLTLDRQLRRVPAIWYVVFGELLAVEFWDKGGWQSLSEYADIYIDALYDPLGRAVSQMEVPYEGVPTDCLRNLPNLSIPITDATRLDFEMSLALDCVNSCRMFKIQAPILNSPGPSSPKLRANSPQDCDIVHNVVSYCFEKMVFGRRNRLRASGTFELVTPIPDDEEVNQPITKVSDLKEPSNPTKDLVVNLESPTDPPMNPDVVETSPPKYPEKGSIVEDAASRQPESPDLQSRKRSRVLETTDDIKPPSPKQLKPSG